MKIRAAFLIGAGVGYLVGTPVGRRQVERIAARVKELLGETRPWSGGGRARPVGVRAVSAATAALSSKVVDAARAAARAAGAAPRVIVRPTTPRPSDLEMSYRMPSQRSRRDGGNGHTRRPRS
jgi:hypothetical protein